MHAQPVVSALDQRAIHLALTKRCLHFLKYGLDLQRCHGAFYYHSRSEIAYLHIRIVKIERVGQSARI